MGQVMGWGPWRKGLELPGHGCGPARMMEGVRIPWDCQGSKWRAHRTISGAPWWTQGETESEGASVPCPALLQVGFLKILHRYEITFTLPPVHRLSKDVRDAPVPSLHLKLLSVMPIPEGASPAWGAESLPSSSRAWV